MDWLWRRSGLLGLSIALFITSLPAQAESDCEEHNLPIVELLALGGSPARRTLYHRGSSNERQEHAEGMQHAGFLMAEPLIEATRSQIPRGTPLLEIGPYMNPLHRLIRGRHPRIIWEYDSIAAQELANDPRLRVFRLDLNRLDMERWAGFWAQQRNVLGIAETETRSRIGFGAAILSSVLNYLNYDVVLAQLIEQMADGGILFIANSNIGDTSRMRGRRPLLGSEILEHLLLEYPDRIEILPGSRYHWLRLDGSHTGIALALRIHHSPLPAQDRYLLGLRMFTEYVSAPHAVRYPAPTEGDQDILNFWHSTDPSIVAEARREQRAINRQIYRPNARVNFLAELTQRQEFIQDFCLRVLHAPNGSLEQRELERQLSLDTFRQNFLPERRILLSALNRRQSSRRNYMRTQLTTLYERLGHSTTLDWLR